MSFPYLLEVGRFNAQNTSDGVRWLDLVFLFSRLNMSSNDEEKGLRASHANTDNARTLSYEQPFLPVFHRKFANPSPLAFTALGTGLFLVAIVALGADGLSSLSIVVSVALGYSAFALLVAGIWEFPIGNTFGATVYISYGGLWGSLALILSPWSDIATSYKDASEFSHAIGIYFFSWFITSVIFTIAAHRSSGGLLIFLVLVDFEFLFLGLFYLLPAHTKFLTAAGSFGIIAAFVAWYAALASLLETEVSYFQLPVIGNFSRRT